MCCAGKWAAAFIVAAIAIVAGFVRFTSVDAAQQPDAKDAKEAKETKLDLTALREAVGVATKRGENVDEIRKALDVFAKAAPTVKAGAVPPELQALRDAVDAAARKGENVEAIAKELLAVEMIVAGKSLAKPRPEPRPDPRPNPNPFPNPAVPFLDVPFPRQPNRGGVDDEVFKKVLALRVRALELWNKNPRDPEALKLWEEAEALLMKAGGKAGPAMPIGPLFPEIARVPDRARFGIRMERVPPVAAEQLGLEPNTGIVVSLVMPNSAAEKAGIKVHDIVLEFGGKPVSDNLDDFIRRVGEAKAGEKINIVVMRKGKKVEVKGVELPEVQARPVLPPLAVPVLPNLPIDQPRAKRSGVGTAPPGFSGVSYTTDKGTFKLKATKDKTLYVLGGTINDEGNVTLTKAVVDADGKIHIAESLDKVNEAYRPDVVKLLQTIEAR